MRSTPADTAHHGLKMPECSIFFGLDELEAAINDASQPPIAQAELIDESGLSAPWANVQPDQILNRLQERLAQKNASIAAQPQAPSPRVGRKRGRPPSALTAAEKAAQRRQNARF